MPALCVFVELPGVIPLAVCPHHPTAPARQEDHSFGRQVAEPYFDTQLNGWVLSRYADVTAAFNSPDLVLVGSASKAEYSPLDEAARLRMRAETRDALSPAALRSWRKQMLYHARARVAQFECDQVIDLIKDYAEPLCLELAILVTQPDPNPTQYLATLAAHVSWAAAEPLNEQLKVQSKLATAELQSFFTKGPEPMRDSGFVALSQTLVSLLGNAWFALAQHPQEWKRLHMRPALVARGVEELQRFAGLTRVLFRRAIADTTLNGLSIRNGDRVILSLPAANRDPERYPEPHEFSVTRPRISHVSLGAGPHACVGAPLIRMATIAATLALVERFPSVQLVPPIEWRGGIGFVSPMALPVLPATQESTGSD
jgi:cytochrome P450